jgi:uncharacterized phiE125 gp8 family phage protein
MLAPRLITAPAALPVTLAEAKARLRIEFSDDDAVASALLGAAVSHVDGWNGAAHRALVTQTWEDAYDGFSDEMRLSVGPVASVTSVTYEKPDGTDEVLGAANYALLEDVRGHFIAAKPDTYWPQTGRRRDAVRIRYAAGQAAADVPEAIKAAICLIFGDLYANRETVHMGAVNAIPMSVTVDRLLAPYRRQMVA